MVYKYLILFLFSFSLLASEQSLLFVDTDFEEFQGCTTEILLGVDNYDSTPRNVIFDIDCKLEDSHTKEVFPFSQLNSEGGVPYISKKSKILVAILRMREILSEDTINIDFYYIYSGFPPKKYRYITLILNKNEKGIWGVKSKKTGNDLGRIFLKARTNFLGITLGVIPVID